MGSDTNRHRFLLQVMKMFWNQTAVMVAQLYEYTKKHCITHLQGVNFIIQELNLNEAVI